MTQHLVWNFHSSIKKSPLGSVDISVHDVPRFDRGIQLDLILYKKAVLHSKSLDPAVKPRDVGLEKAPEKDKLKWEARFFWPDKEPISLNIIDNFLLDLNQYEKKNKDDYYYLIPNTNYNIKHRGDRLLYKPIIEQTLNAIGFGRKINLKELEEYPNKKNLNPLILEKILNQTQTIGIKVPVTKESYTFKFATTPSIKLELARLEVHNKIYYSACIEGRSRFLVETISEALLGKQKSCDYVSFLNTIVAT